MNDARSYGWTLVILLWLATATNAADVLLIVGAPGTSEYGQEFQQWQKQWESNCQTAGLELTVISGDDASDEMTNRQSIEKMLASVAGVASQRPLWIVLIGHGTWDGNVANFNLVGPDLDAKTLSGWIASILRPVVLVNCSSSSGPYIDRLSGPNRVVVTATKSGSEQNYARFGKYFSDAFGSLEADLDHDDSVSVREAFLKATADTARFYDEQGRLATEHSLLDDNGDQMGSSFDMVRGKKKAKGKAQIDGEFAGRIALPIGRDAPRLNDDQLAKRNQLEQQLRELQSNWDSDDRTQLRQQALPLLLQLAELYAQSAENAGE
ncbi:hypothetical protein NHH03_15715 [Stieleria sp. TO1_6]|uniref:hypothetical protein n=1 Tax=Stieleria tagensis TaxID=2956795 RepID=UPI00209AA6EF|nr:hypothetical protein [Stieleria tagensis]MCO8123196.1 hypothetical protein [Stieleria tagensis]